MASDPPVGLGPLRPPHSTCGQQLSPVLLTDQLQTRGFRDPSPLGSINLVEWLTELGGAFYLLTGSPAYYKRIQLGNSQMEKMHWARDGEGTQRLHAVQEHRSP